MVRLAVEMTVDNQLNVSATGCSGWVVQNFMRFELQTVVKVLKRYSAVGGSYIEIPAVLQKVSRSLDVHQ